MLNDFWGTLSSAKSRNFSCCKGNIFSLPYQSIKTTLGLPSVVNASRRRCSASRGAYMTVTLPQLVT